MISNKNSIIYGETKKEFVELIWSEYKVPISISGISILGVLLYSKFGNKKTEGMSDNNSLLVSCNYLDADAYVLFYNKKRRLIEIIGFCGNNTSDRYYFNSLGNRIEVGIEYEHLLCNWRLTHWDTYHQALKYLPLNNKKFKSIDAASNYLVNKYRRLNR